MNHSYRFAIDGTPVDPETYALTLGTANRALQAENARLTDELAAERASSAVYWKFICVSTTQHYEVIRPRVRYHRQLPDLANDQPEDGGQ